MTHEDSQAACIRRTGRARLTAVVLAAAFGVVGLLVGHAYSGLSSGARESDLHARLDKFSAAIDAKADILAEVAQHLDFTNPEAPARPSTFPAIHLYDSGSLAGSVQGAKVAVPPPSPATIRSGPRWTSSSGRATLLFADGHPWLAVAPRGAKSGGLAVVPAITIIHTAAKESGIVALSAPNDKSEHFSWRSDSNTPHGRIHFKPVPPGAEGTELVAGFEKVFQFPWAIPGCILGLILGFLLSLWHEKRSASATATALAAQSVEHNESLKTINNMLDGLVEEYGVALNGSASAGSLEALIVAKSRKLIAYFEVRLKQTEALHATMLKLLETSRAGVMRIDSEMRISWVSDGMESLLGCSGAGLVGRSFNALIQTAEERTRFSADWKFLAQGSRISQEVNLVAEDGGHILVFLSAMPEYSPEGLFDGASVMLQDRGRLYLARKEEFAREGLDEVSRLAADVAHGFNNALCAIIGGLSLIELKLKTGHPEVMGGSLGDKFDIVSGAAERATLLVRQLMKLAPGVESTAGEAPLGPVLDEVIRALPSTWAIQQAKTDTLLPVVRMNRLLLRSVLTEAITRVREKTDPEKQVRISVSLRDSEDEPGHEPTPPLCCVEVYASQRRVIRNRETGRSGKGEGLKWFETQRLVQDSGGSVVEDSRHLPSPNIVIFLPVTATPRPVVFEGGR